MKSHHKGTVKGNRAMDGISNSIRQFILNFVTLMSHTKIANITVELIYFPVYSVHMLNNAQQFILNCVTLMSHTKIVNITVELIHFPVYSVHMLNNAQTCQRN